jgi:glyoxylase-like metal-dependent hydrolase (beta-lactamase superfamily II)
MRDKISEGIFVIPGRNRGSYPFCNSLYIEDEVRAVIDPASDRKELQRLTDVRLAILSHFHQDHVREIRALPMAEAAVHESEAEALADWRKYVPLVFFPDESQQDIDEWLQTQIDLVKPEQWHFRVGRKLRDKDEISLGRMRLQVIHTPGHTLGHCCFWFPEPEILFSGDIDLSDFGPWYGNACSNLADFVNSLDKLKPYNPKLVITAHEAGVVKEEDFHSRLARYKEVIFTREQKILDALSSPNTLEEVVDLGTIYGDYLRQARDLRPIERRMVIHHLRWLEQKGMAKCENGIWRRKS